MRVIELSQGKMALVDDEDYDSLSQFKWYACKADKKGNLWYARRNVWVPKHTVPKMHQEVAKSMGIEGIVDHRDGDGLNNQRDNLRPCTRQQNQCNQRLNSSNTSGYRGVSWDKRNGMWTAQTRYFGKKVGLGSFHSREEAARAYDAWMLATHGEFARLNFPVGEIPL